MNNRIKTSKNFDKRAIGQRIAEAMEKEGLNQADLKTAIAEAGYNISPQAIYKWVKSGSINLEHIEIIAPILHCSPGWLAFGETSNQDEAVPARRKEDRLLAELWDRLQTEHKRLFLDLMRLVTKPDAKKKATPVIPGPTNHIRLRSALSHARLSQRATARYLNISPSTVNRWLNAGDTSIRPDHLSRIAHRCGVSSIWLMQGQGEMLEMEEAI